MSNPLQHGFPPPRPVGGVTGPLPLYRELIRPGDLCFDIGAHVGDHTQAMLLCGAAVVSVEPQWEQARQIPGQAAVVQAAVSDQAGTVELHVCAANSYMSTLDISGNYRAAVQQHWPPGYDFAETRTVPAVTMDMLIERYGLPRFAKIDVEGAEPAVLAGLSHEIEIVSFEVHDFDRAKADRCVERLMELGDYRFRYSPTESYLLERWPADRLAIFGDIYAFLQT